MVNLTATLSTLITANHILHFHNVLDSMGHVSVRNPNNNGSYFIALQIGPNIVSGPADIGEYLVEDSSPVNGTEGGYAERYIHGEILKRYPDINAVVHSHAEDVLPYTVVGGAQVEPAYHMAGFLGASTPNFDIATTSTYQEPLTPKDMLINTLALGADLASYFGTNTTRPTSPLHPVVLQRGHGFAVAAESVEQVVDFAYYTASNARVQTKAILLANAMGGDGGGNESKEGVRYLSMQERKATNEMNRWIVFKPWKSWVREVERSGQYVNELGSPPGA